MPTTTQSSRSASAARTEVINMLKEDHKRAKKAFKDFEKMDPDENADECRDLIEQTCAELTVHATLEEELFYPAIHHEIREPELIDEAEVEHATAKQLIAQLQEPMDDDARYVATFRVLGEYINHHVKEEEGEIFDQLSRAKVDWAELAEAMRSRRSELMAEVMPDSEASGEEAGDDAEEASSGTAASASRARAASGDAARRSASNAGSMGASARSSSSDEAGRRRASEPRPSASRDDEMDETQSDD